MRKLIFCAALAATIAPVQGQAQVTVDMSRITCADYLKMPQDQSQLFSSFMSGWFNHRWGYVTVGMDDFNRNVANVKQWCTGNASRSVMAALETSIPQPGPPTGQVKVDMSLITCKQFLAAPNQDMIAYWMSGYFRASRSQITFDFNRFASNKRAIVAHCRKNGGETVMSAIQKKVR